MATRVSHGLDLNKSVIVYDIGFIQIHRGVAVFGPGDDLFLVSRADAPRGKLLRLDTKHLDPAQAKTIVPEGEDAIVMDAGQ